jgi:hypothetical protein
MPMQHHHSETFYVWQELVQCEGETEPRLLDPWRDPFIYETPFNFQFASREEAQQVKASNDFGPSSEEKGWILCKVTIEVVE